MAGHACLKNEFTEDEKYHNLMSWLTIDYSSLWSQGFPSILSIESLHEKACLRGLWSDIISAHKLASLEILDKWGVDLSSEQQRRWSDCTNAQADLLLKMLFAYTIK